MSLRTDPVLSPRFDPPLIRYRRLCWVAKNGRSKLTPLQGFLRSVLPVLRRRRFRLLHHRVVYCVPLGPWGTHSISGITPVGNTTRGVPHRTCTIGAPSELCESVCVGDEPVQKDRQCDDPLGQTVERVPDPLAWLIWRIGYHQSSASSLRIAPVWGAIFNSQRRPSLLA